MSFGSFDALDKQASLTSVLYLIEHHDKRKGSVFKFSALFSSLISGEAFFVGELCLRSDSLTWSSSSGIV